MDRALVSLLVLGFCVTSAPAAHADAIDTLSDQIADMLEPTFQQAESLSTQQGITNESDPLWNQTQDIHSLAASAPLLGDALAGDAWSIARTFGLIGITSCSRAEHLQALHQQALAGLSDEQLASSGLSRKNLSEGMARLALLESRCRQDARSELLRQATHAISGLQQLGAEEELASLNRALSQSVPERHQSAAGPLSFGIDQSAGSALKPALHARIGSRAVTVSGNTLQVDDTANQSAGSARKPTLHARIGSRAVTVSGNTLQVDDTAIIAKDAEVIDAKVYVQGREVASIPDRLDDYYRITVTSSSGRLVYLAQHKEPCMLLGLIPIHMTLTTIYDAEDTGDILDEKAPWWGFLTSV
ncbi:hypothetical protein COV94_05490 [Candidatus Woesearchaeota archaeon CG11_big_fil_rev_8_21_14_0_20_57_5]|nr:MAG: hypothetical protein COV94_05490 [Candidatus Woesearchaeota archaeon CG11_big_fil_rev_8_21_14_0_20_57_5]